MSPVLEKKLARRIAFVLFAGVGGAGCANDPEEVEASDATILSDVSANSDVTNVDTSQGDAAGDAPTVQDSSGDGDAALTDSSPGDSAASCNDCLSFQVSAPVPVLWTGGNLPVHVPDNLFVVLSFPGLFVDYVSATYTYRLSASSLLGLNQDGFSATPVLSPGPQGQFDDCGAWLHGIEVISGINRVGAWYHAEGGEYCNGTGGGTHTKSIAYVESSDNGASFSKVGYPNNVVLTGSQSELAQAPTAKTVGVGDFTIVKKDGDYYLFYLNALKAETCLARATVASGGRPGSWLKWHNGSFSQPGIGGEDSCFGLQLAGVSFNATLNQFVALTYGISGTVGFKVAISADGTSWTILDAPLVPGGVRWADSPSHIPNGGVTPFGYSQYQTIIGPDGSKIWGDSFYLYYLYIRPGEDFSKRFMLRSQVKMEVAAPPIASPRASTALERYFSASAKKHWVTSGLAVPTSGTWDFHDDGSLGRVFTSEAAGLVELADCVYGGSHYIVSLGGQCASGQTKLRTIGWIHSKSLPQPANTHAIYRCYSSVLDSHFVSLDPACEGSQAEGLLGFALD